MPLYITSLNSGSNGNCYYIGNNCEAILVDAGISCREIERRMDRLGLQMSKVKAVFISHEHTDHIKGLASLSKRFRIPVYITPATMLYGRIKIDTEMVRTFLPHEPITLGNLSITAFPKFHDAQDPYSFSVSCNGLKVGVFTDIGTPCNHLVSHFKECHAAFLEANYDEVMLENGNYPYFLKARIRGGRGHLSNKQALELFTVHRAPFMSHLVLAHLSKNNNCPDMVNELFKGYAGSVRITVAGRYGETEVICIEDVIDTSNTIAPKKYTTTQLSFSFS